jgi:hypothetical protein
MTKTLRALLLLFVTLTSLGSCTSGWTDEFKTDITRSCEAGMRMSFSEEESASICACYIDNLVKKYPAMDYTSAQNTAELDACSADAKSKLLEEKSRLFEDTSTLDPTKIDSLLKDSTDQVPAP